MQRLAILLGLAHTGAVFARRSSSEGLDSDAGKCKNPDDNDDKKKCKDVVEECAAPGATVTFTDATITCASMYTQALKFFKTECTSDPTGSKCLAAAIACINGATATDAICNTSTGIIKTAWTKMLEECDVPAASRDDKSMRNCAAMDTECTGNVSGEGLLTSNPTDCQKAAAGKTPPDEEIDDDEIEKMYPGCAADTAVCTPDVQTVKDAGVAATKAIYDLLRVSYKNFPSGELKDAECPEWDEEKNELEKDSDDKTKMKKFFELKDCEGGATEKCKSASMKTMKSEYQAAAEAKEGDKDKYPTFADKHIFGAQLLVEDSIEEAKAEALLFIDIAKTQKGETATSLCFPKKAAKDAACKEANDCVTNYCDGFVAAVGTKAEVLGKCEKAPDTTECIIDDQCKNDACHGTTGAKTCVTPIAEDASCTVGSGLPCEKETTCKKKDAAATGTTCVKSD